MIATGLLATRITALRQSRWFRSIMGIALILFGIWTIPMVQQLFTATDPRLIMLKKPRQQNGYNPVAVGGIGDIVRGSSEAMDGRSAAYMDVFIAFP